MAEKIYALLVGINDYDESVRLGNHGVYFPRLNGPVGDATKIKLFLEKNYKPESLFIKELFNQEATKENICNTFLSHLSQAEKDDSILFYFSGHGTQENADPCFGNETDRKLESFVGWYDQHTVGNCLVADKEFRYLLQKVAKKGPHITVIIDCCHSGDMTRNLEVVGINYDRPVEKRSKGTYTFDQRDWKNFIFSNEFSADDIRKKGLDNLLPETDHILFSASESDESAYEIGGEGIFTKHLNTILNTTNGAISNQLLYDRLAMIMKYAYIQRPRIYTPVKAEKLRSTSFLNSTGIFSSATANAFYNQKKGWMINRGQLMGITAGLRINLFDPGDKSIRFEALVKEVAIDHALLEITNDADKARAYAADLDYLLRKKIRLYTDIEGAIPKDVATLLESIGTITTAKIELTDKAAEADYSLRSLNGIFYLARKDDNYRPISSVVFSPDYTELQDQLEHLSQWEYINDLVKEPPVNADDFLSIEYALGKNDYKHLVQNKGLANLTIDSWEPTQFGFETTIKMRFTNRSAKGIYIAVLYLDINYVSDSFLLEPAPYYLDPGATAELNLDGNPNLPVSFYEQALYFNYPQYEERFKIIASDKPFELYPLRMAALPEPPLPGKMREREVKSVARGGIGRPAALEGWFITTVKMMNINPAYNRIAATRLKEMLEDDLTAMFAEKLFFNIAENEVLERDLELKPEITIVDEQPGAPEGKERGVIVDIANWYSRRKRNRYYQDIARRYPERTRIVSEGDSWFQHPLVYDIIDHLSKVYAIRCVAAAADTLSNYFSGADKRGDYYLDVLTDVKPTFFLISGGGNDILGSQFRGFLVDNPYDKGFKNSTDGRVFLKQSFDHQIDALMNIYSSMFSLLKTRFPDMRTVVHGYDYPVHLDHPSKGWLGRYMIEKGISEPGDRRTAIKYIMDVFNKRLKEVVDHYADTVYYLDLRGTVLFKEKEIDQWYDEIHPNLEGFQAIGLKYIKLIESLKSKPHLTERSFSSSSLDSVHSS